MEVPELTSNGGVYVLRWEEAQLGIRIDRLSEDSHHSVSGEILVKTTAPGFAPHLHQARFNLTSTTARKTLANALLQRVAEIDWYAVLEQVCVKVLSAYREGEPVIKLADVKPREGSRWRVNPLLLEQEPTTFFGEGGSGKSLLGAYLSVLIDTPLSQNKLEVEPGKVLYLDYEGNRYDLQERVAAIKKAVGSATPSAIRYRFCHQPIAADIQDLQRIVADEEIDVVVVDSAGPACGGRPEEAEFAIGFFRALRALKCTNLIIAHETKVQENRAPKKAPFGSVYFFNLSRAVYHVIKKQEQGEEAFSIALLNTKANFTRLQSPMGFKITLTSLNDRLEAVSFAKLDTITVPEFAVHSSLRQRIKAALQHGAKTVQELILDLEQTQDDGHQLRNRLNDYRDIDFVKLPGEKGEWGLKSGAHTPPLLRERTPPQN